MSTSFDWPDEFRRTPDGERTAYPHGFQVSREQAFQNIIEEVRKFDDLRGFKIETAATHQSDSPQIPTQTSDPEDPGVVLYWNRSGEAFAAPGDRWQSLRDNAQAIYHYLKAKRGMERWGVETVDSEFSTQLLEKAALD